MKRLILFILISFLLSVGYVFAFDVSVTPEKATVDQGSTASYTFRLSRAYDSVYTLSTSAENSNWMTLPTRVETVNGNGEFTLLITAPRNALPITHGFPVTMRSNSDPSDVVTSVVYLTVRPKEGIKIDRASSSFSDYRAGEPILLDIVVRSDEPEKRDVDMIFDIKNPDGTDLRSVKTRITVQKDSTSEFTQSFDLGQLPPGRYPVSITIKRDFHTYDTHDTGFEITSTSNLIRTKETSWTFLAIKSIIKVQNVGNSPAENVDIRDSVPMFWSYFVDDNSASKTSADSDVVYTWRLASVDPSESETIKYQINLWPIYLIFAGLIAAGFKGYTTFFMPSLSKSFITRANLGAGKEGSIVISAKNKGFATLHNVIIDDVVPPSFKITDASVPRPKYKKSYRGSEIRWTLGTLAPGEERIFSYKVKSVLGIIGKVELPRAHMRANGDKYYKSKPLSTAGDKHKKHI